MDREEIRYLLGEEVLAHASKLEDKVRDLQEETSGRGVRHLSALVRSGGQSCRAPVLAAGQRHLCQCQLSLCPERKR